MQDSRLDAAQAELHEAYQVYRSAMTGWRAASKAGHPERTDKAAERLLRARVGLYRRLVDSGWGPPPGLSAQLDRDAALLEAPEDFDELLGV